MPASDRALDLAIVQVNCPAGRVGIRLHRVHVLSHLALIIRRIVVIHVTLQVHRFLDSTVLWDAGRVCEVEAVQAAASLRPRVHQRRSRVGRWLVVGLRVGRVSDVRGLQFRRRCGGLGCQLYACVGAPLRNVDGCARGLTLWGQAACEFVVETVHLDAILDLGRIVVVRPADRSNAVLCQLVAVGARPRLRIHDIRHCLVLLTRIIVRLIYIWSRELLLSTSVDVDRADRRGVVIGWVVASIRQHPDHACLVWCLK